MHIARLGTWDRTQTQKGNIFSFEVWQLLQFMSHGNPFYFVASNGDSMHLFCNKFTYIHMYLHVPIQIPVPQIKQNIKHNQA